MNAAEFRHRLASVAGGVRYRQFLRSVNGGCRWRGRFLYWQEALLAEAGVAASSPAELFICIEPLLRVCELHNLELQPDPDGLTQRCRGGAVTEFTIVQGKSFPNTDCGPSRPGDRSDSFRHGLWYCPECRAAEVGWRERTAFYQPADVKPRD
jgi:hypothetical protein